MGRQAVLQYSKLPGYHFLPPRLVGPGGWDIPSTFMRRALVGSNFSPLWEIRGFSPTHTVARVRATSFKLSSSMLKLFQRLRWHMKRSRQQELRRTFVNGSHAATAGRCDWRANDDALRVRREYQVYPINGSGNTIRILINVIRLGIRSYLHKRNQMLVVCWINEGITNFAPSCCGPKPNTWTTGLLSSAWIPPSFWQLNGT